MWDTLAGRYVSSVNDVHQKYGPVVRIAPDAVSFSTAPAWKGDLTSHNQVVIGPKVKVANDKEQTSMGCKKERRSLKRITNDFLIDRNRFIYSVCTQYLRLHL